MRTILRAAVVATAALTLLAAGLAAAAPPFIEPEAELVYRLDGQADGDIFGWVGAALGDIDGDGAGDFAIPAITDPSGGPAAGKLYVYSGATGTVVHTIEGGPNDLLGFSVDLAGDVDADGVGDYVVGAPAPGTGNPGRVLVVSGADHSLIHEVVASGPSFFGSAVAGAGDLDGDGHADFAVGDRFGGSAGTFSAFSGADASLLWTIDGLAAGDQLGSAAGLVGDVNDDGVPDLSVGAFQAGTGGAAYVVSGADGAVIHVLEPVGNASVFGQFFASGAGDVDDDGVGDVFVADYNHNGGDGQAYVFSGATGALLHLFTAGAAGEGFGPGRGVGDLNDDDHADLIIAAYTSSEGAPSAGKATVFSGDDGSVLRTITHTVAQDDFGVDALSVGDVTGDGLPDFLVTAAGPSFNLGLPGTSYVVAGIDLEDDDDDQSDDQGDDQGDDEDDDEDQDDEDDD